MSISPELPEQLAQLVQSTSVIEQLQVLCDKYPGEVAFSTSFGEEDQVLTHMIASAKIPVRIFTLDTGRLFQETYDLADLTRSKFGLSIEVYIPDNKLLEGLILNKGFNSFYRSVENRKECCFVRKIEPLNRALKGVSIWVTGLRASQNDNRSSMNLFDFDEGRKMLKFNPLIHWDDEQVRAYIKEHKIPVNSLHSKGYPSIGCAPCTKAVAPGEHPRSGRWWWENSGKECGLHG
jgi:phosphoadenosine phosphosulfate reductase